MDGRPSFQQYSMEAIQMSGRDYQHQDDDTYVKVGAGYSRDQGVPTSDFIIGDRNDPNGHQHVVINDSGDEIYNQYNQNH